jgi:hypothetical protein
MSTLVVECERCKKVRACSFHGRPCDVGEDITQNGEWLCERCVPARARELDTAIEHMRRMLGREGGTEGEGM